MAASPLTAARGGVGLQSLIYRDLRPLAAGVSVFQGSLAACVGGYYQVASGTAGEVIVGHFTQSKSNPGAAGAVSAEVDFNRGRNIFLLDNDTTAAVTVAMRERAASALDDHTAQAFSAAIGASFVVYDVTSEGVFVEFVRGSTTGIQSGTTTLVSGTKTVTGVSLTANSVIVMSMRDPGAGALTSFAGFDAPVASRNTGTGQFVINAIDASKATLASAVCTVDYLIVG